AVSAGGNVLALQRMLGHTSAKMSLDTYADLFDDDLDAVAASLHARYSREVTRKCAQNVPTEGVQGAAGKQENYRLPAQTPLQLGCGRRESNPHALSSNGT